MKADADIIVVGGGLAGLAAAISLSRAGHQVIHLAPPAPIDRRTSALMMPSVDFLCETGLIDDPAEIGHALTAIRIIDATARLIRAPETLFDAKEIGLAAFGWNFPNARLLERFQSAAPAVGLETRNQAVTNWRRVGDLGLVTLADGTQLSAPLVVGADGKKSLLRAAAGISTRDGFGDAQLHVEWMSPVPVAGESQDRGNSGVFLMGRYEVQVLDSYDNATYPDGQAGAVYGQYPPLVNASRPPGEWQMYDIIFHRPRFDAQGKVTQPARMTVLHNGVLVQDNVVLSGPTGHTRRPPYEKHDDRLPIGLQDHGQRVRFRNIWIRDLERP